MREPSDGYAACGTGSGRGREISMKKKKKKKKKKKGKFFTVILSFIFLTGLSLLLYPTVSNYWNAAHQSRAIYNYSHAVEELSEENYAELLTAARDYNASLLQKADRYELNEKEREEYRSLLNIEGNGVMGYIDIPRIDVTMPVYHTTDSDILQFAAGHIPGTSLPVGGTGTHCAISGHRGLPSAKLFTDLDKLQTGDLFYVNVLKERLAYEVDQVLIVEPDNMEPLEIDPGADQMTLITCTPYAINTHRLLVRGHRIEAEDPDGTVSFTSEAFQISPTLVASIISVPALGFLLILTVVSRKKRSASDRARRRYQKGKRL